jgi:REP element-mobilizing transposase RayT
MSDPLAYFLTWHTYGTWLPGHTAGSVNEAHCQFGTPFAPPDPKRLAHCAAELAHPPVALDAPRRTAVQAAIVEVCAYRGWTLLAVHVRTTHVHAVVSASPTPEKILNDFKAYATRRLRREKLAAPDLRIWSGHGSTRYVWKDEELAAVLDYVVNRQGVALEPLPITSTLPRPPGMSEPGASATGSGGPVADAPGSDS